VEPASQRIADVARALGIEHLLDRSIDGLSGGERQRVALARALAPRPHVLLLDEPLASLDPRTRRHLRDELRLAHAAEGSTVLHVTHDFEDALALGDQVAVMHEGRLLQSGTPVDVFRKPATPFVAEFIGSGNLLAGVVEASDADRAVFRSGPVALQVVSDRRGGCHALIQPEEILVSRTPLPSPPRNRLTGRIVRIEITGPLARIHLDVGVGVAALLTRVSVEEMALQPEEVVHVAIKATAIHIM
jgi:molybdopterin-binding protein